MPIEIRTAKASESKEFFKALASAFSSDWIVEEDERFADLIEQDRMIVAVDGATIVGATATYTFNLSVPGGDVPAGGVTMVGVLPTHRRRGILSKMVHVQFEDSRERGEPIAVLWASEGAIYTNFGYGMATRHGAIDIERERTTIRVPPASGVRSVLLSKDEALKTFPDVYERMRAVVPGMNERSMEWWKLHRFHDPESERDGASPMIFVLIEIDGNPEAYAIYNVLQKWGPDGISASVLDVLEEGATSPVARVELWRWLFGVDLIARFRAYWLAIDHPLTWVLEEPRRLRMRVQDGLWLRIIDLGEALARRAYLVDGRIVLEVTDEAIPDNTGRWSVDVNDGRAEVARTQDPADLTLGVEDLGCTYLGGVSFTELASATRVVENTKGALRRADAMWRWTPAPWNPEIF
jgi:predicted acetyltransferase